MYTPEQEKQYYDTAKALLAAGTGNAAQMEPLRNIINWADWKYYVQSESTLADVEYDQLYKKLVHLEEQYPEEATADSPTQRVARGLSEKFPSVSHLVPMLSLDNTYNADDLYDWDRKVREGAAGEPIRYCVEPKYDGASISLIYEGNSLVRGATRGDGVMGEEITPNIRQIKSIPLSAPFLKDGVDTIEIRGEVVIHKETFAAFNTQRTAEGLSPLANPRNAASGTLRMLDPREVSKRRLTAILYNISYTHLDKSGHRPAVLDNHYDSLQWLYSLGFPTPAKELRLFDNIEDVITHCADFEKRRDDFPFEVDGLVIKVNSLELQDKLGMTSHHPRWAVAYKFSARQATTKLLRIDYQVGRTGSITPVAKTAPVPLGGVTISSLSLFNEDIIREKDVRIGDTVLIERAGDVIPYVVKPLAELRDGTEQPIAFPTHCPACCEPLERPQDEAVWRCINISCPAQVVERMIHFGSKDAMDIRSLGDANVRKFWQLGLIRDIPGIYRIDWGKVGTLAGFGPKSVTNLQAAIEQSKTQPLSRLIFGLGIRHVGETTAKTLANAVTHLNELYDWTAEQFITLEDIGPKVAASVVHFFHNPENRHMLSELDALGLNLRNEHKAVASAGQFSGRTFLFTGTLTRLKRSEAEAMAEAQGGTILSGVSSKLNYLVVGEDAGSKLEKAKKLGTVAVLSEEDFMKMMAGT
jgi:DNA ligase (NAD+)